MKGLNTKKNKLSKKRNYGTRRTRRTRRIGGFELDSNGKFVVKETEIAKLRELLNKPDWSSYNTPKHKHLVLELLELVNKLNNTLKYPRFREVVLRKLQEIPNVYPDLKQEAEESIKYIKSFEDPNVR